MACECFILHNQLSMLQHLIFSDGFGAKAVGADGSDAVGTDAVLAESADADE